MESPEKVDKINVNEINEAKNAVDLSYADMDIDDIENPIVDNSNINNNNVLPEGDGYDFDKEKIKEQVDNNSNNNNNNSNDNSNNNNEILEEIPEGIPQEQNVDKEITNDKTVNNVIEDDIGIEKEKDNNNNDNKEQEEKEQEQEEKEKEKEQEQEQEQKQKQKEEQEEKQEKQEHKQIKNENILNNISIEEGNNIFQKNNQSSENNNKPKGWKLDQKWEWCRNISIVYTWVNGSDPHHQEIKSKYNGGIKKVDQRDRSMDELRYSLRSLEKNLPWHEGMIYIVSPGQVPHWLDTNHPRVKVIDQATLLPPDTNPTFNSFSIEFYLDKIPGLTERFIQLNDDYFFKRYIHPSFFFNKKKFPNFYYGRTHVHKGFNEAYQIAELKTKTSWLKKYWGSIFHTNGVIKEKYGDQDHIVMLQHAPYVWYRDIFEPMRQFYGKYITQTLSHKFRHPLDLIPTYAHQHYIINMASKSDYSIEKQPSEFPQLDFGFYPHKNVERWITEYGYRPLSRNAVKNYIRFGTVLDDKKKSMKLFNAIKNGPYLMFNLNDDYTTEEPGQWLLDFMNEMFPNKSLFEKD